MTGTVLGKVFAALAALMALAGVARGSINYADVPFPAPGAPGGSLELDLYLPDSGIPTRDYTIVLVHGGSYSQGSRAEVASLAAALADMGFAVVNPDYTLTTATFPSFPQAIRDVLSCVKWVRTDGAVLQLPGPVVLAGISAGSTISAVAANASDVPFFQPGPPPPGEGYTIDGFIGMMGRYDMVWNAIIGLPQTVIAYLGQQIGAPSWLGWYQQASAVNHVSACSPPAALFHGTSDNVVPFYNSVLLQQAMATAQAPVRLTLVPGVGHDMSAIGLTATAQAQTIAASVAWIYQNAQTSCGRYGAPPPPPPPPTGSCCSPDGACAVTDQASCSAAWTLAGACDPNPCPQPIFAGACCAGATCLIALPSECTGDNHRFAGQNVACGAAGGPPGPCCRADFTQDSHVAVSDIFAYLAAWFAGRPEALVSTPAGNAPAVQDIFDYLTAWFAGC